MKYSVETTIIYLLNGKEVKETYSSLLECAKHYNISIQTLRSIIAGHSRLKNRLPENAIFELKPLHSDKIEHLWHCDLCDTDIKPTSKSNHLLSLKHRQKIVGEK